MGMIDEGVRDQVARLLADGERVEAEFEAEDASILITDQRVLVLQGRAVTMNCPISRLRRIQLDVERGVPATMAIVPEDLTVIPQILRLVDDSLATAASAVGLVGQRLG
jgi:hypothetical protein